MLSLAASTSAGYAALPEHWKICEQQAAASGKSVSREQWRVATPMHIAATRDQAWSDAKQGAFDTVKYFCALLGDYAPESMRKVSNGEEAMRLWTGEGLSVFGVLMAGTPDDAIRYIEDIHMRSGGFGTFLFLAHNCADFAATCRSYDLFARHVMPHFRRSNAAREESVKWVSANSTHLFGGLVKAQERAVGDFEAKAQAVVGDSAHRTAGYR
jgi:limonene 1,2-monooxygenase